jgi:hypothetical protein
VLKGRRRVGQLFHRVPLGHSVEPVGAWSELAPKEPSAGDGLAGGSTRTGVRVYGRTVLSREDLEGIRRSVAMSPSLPAEQLRRLVETLAAIVERGCCTGDPEDHEPSGDDGQPLRRRREERTPGREANVLPPSLLREDAAPDSE